MKEQCSLLPNYYGTSCNFQDLQSAVQQLTTNAEVQFSEIKNEKWFHRVFNMVTFSSKNKIHVADQITSLAQAQSILIEILVRLSDQDANISKMVVQSQYDIKALAQNSAYLQERLYLLEDKSYGIRENENLKNLNGQQRSILCGCLNEASKLYAAPSNEQRLYANALLGTLDADAQVGNLEDALNDLEVGAKRKILSCIITYIYLYDHTAESMEQKSLNDFIDLFDLGQKTIKALKQQAKDVYHLRGVDGCIDRYITDSIKITESTPFEIELFDDINDDSSAGESIEDGSNDEIDTSIAREPLELSGVISIGKRQVYENKSIHFSSAIIDCTGELEFRNCTIHYNENAESHIYLKDGASLAILGSTVICHGNGLDNHFFISSQSANACKMKDSCFVDCVDFVTGSFNSFLFSDNECCDCCLRFLNICAEKQGTTTINTTNFIFAAEPTFKPLSNHESISSSCISISGLHTGESKILVCECTVGCIPEEEGPPCTYMDSIDFMRVDTPEGSHAQIGFCTFTNVKNCVTGAAFIYNCIFKHCHNVISNKIGFDGCTISDNQFIDCCYVAQDLNQGSQIRNCQFFGSTQGNYITTTYGASITIEACEFVNLRFEKSTYYVPGIIQLNSLSKSELKRHGNTKISRCIFNGIQLVSDNSWNDPAFLNPAFLISVSSGQDPVKTPVAIVSECVFRNCATDNKTGELIKQEMTHYGLLNRTTKFRAISVINCTGYDQVTSLNHYTAPTDFKLKQADGDGNRIGSGTSFEELSCEECLKIKADIIND